MKYVDSPLISVVMAVYNGEFFLEEAIKSILNQDYRNIEFIIINDGSTDRSQIIIDKFKAIDSRLISLKTDNQGLAASLNLGISLAKGEWIARMDADDVSLHDRLSSQLIFCYKNSLDICGSAYKHLAKGINFWKRFYVKRYPSSHDEIKALLLFTSAFAHPTVFGRTSLFKKLQYNEELRYSQDYDLWVRVLLHGYRMGNIDKPLLLYRIHSEQASIAKREIQEEIRNDISRSVWDRHGLTTANSSAVRFASEFQLLELLNNVSSLNLSKHCNEIVISEIYKSVMRSFSSIKKFSTRFNLARICLKELRFGKPLYSILLIALLLTNRALR